MRPQRHEAISHDRRAQGSSASHVGGGARAGDAERKLPPARRAWVLGVVAAGLTRNARHAARYIASLPSFPHAFFTVRALGEELGVGQRHARRVLAELSGAGLLERWGSWFESTGLQRSNDYVCCLPTSDVGQPHTDVRLDVGVRPLREDSREREEKEEQQSAREDAPAAAPALPSRPPKRFREPVAAAGTSLALRPADGAGKLGPVLPPVEAPPALLAAVAREHGPDGLRDVVANLREHEARAAPRAALEAVVLLASKPRGQVQNPGGFHRWATREVAAGRIVPLRSDGSGWGAMRRLQDLREEAEQRGALAEAAKLRELAHRAGRKRRADIDQLERQDPEHQAVEHVAELARGEPAPAPPPLSARELLAVYRPRSMALPSPPLTLAEQLRKVERDLERDLEPTKRLRLEYEAQVLRAQRAEEAS